MPYSKAIRPPLLTEWESARVGEFRSTTRRARWLAARALAKALVREHLGMSGIVEIREGADGEPLVFRAGLPLPGTWISMTCRGDRVVAVIGDRPVALDLRPVRDARHELAERIVTPADTRMLKRVLASQDLAQAVAWSMKDASARALRAGVDFDLARAVVRQDLSVQVGDARMQLLAVRSFDDSVVTVVGRQLLSERPVVRIVLHGDHRVDETSGLQAALERSVARARRIADARARWGQRLRWT